MSTVTYPLDMSGNAISNLVSNELHTVSEARFRDFFFIVPRFAPFFIDNFRATITLNNVTRQLVEDVDFSFALSYVTGTRVTGKAMYGAITLHNLSLNGVLSITYQTIGGDQVADRLLVLTTLADKAYNPRTTIWDILTNVPNAFPPTPHFQDYSQFFGQEQLVNSLSQIRDALTARAAITEQDVLTLVNLINTSSASGNNLFANYVKRSGDTLTGPLTLHADPTGNLHPATKQYVDRLLINNPILINILSEYATRTELTQGLEPKVNRSGDTLTGPLTLSGLPTQPLHAVPRQHVDNEVVNLQNEINTLRDSLTPLTTDPVTRTYVDTKIDEIMAWILSRTYSI